MKDVKKIIIENSGESDIGAAPWFVELTLEGDSEMFDWDEIASIICQNLHEACGEIGKTTWETKE